MNAQEMIEALIKEAKLKPIEERALVLWFGLRGEPECRLDERVEIFKADETITAKVTRDWVRTRDAAVVRKLRSAKMHLKIDTDEMIETCKDEPYLSLCNILIGLVE